MSNGNSPPSRSYRSALRFSLLRYMLSHTKMKGILPEEDLEEANPLLNGTDDDLEKIDKATQILTSLILDRLRKSYTIIEEAGEKFVVIKGTNINITDILRGSEGQVDEIQRALQRSKKGLKDIERRNFLQSVCLWTSVVVLIISNLLVLFFFYIKK